jgi:hypothetical protein
VHSEQQQQQQQQFASSSSNMCYSAAALAAALIVSVPHTGAKPYAWVVIMSQQLLEPPCQPLC